MNMSVEGCKCCTYKVALPIFLYMYKQGHLFLLLLWNAHGQAHKYLNAVYLYIVYVLHTKTSVSF